MTIKVVHFATHDLLGGAAKATYRIHQSLGLFPDCSSTLVVYRKESLGGDVYSVPRIYPRVVKRTLDRIKQRYQKLPKASYTFNLDIQSHLDYRHLLTTLPENVDVICLHWITGFLTTELIHRLYSHYSKPIVWIMMDQEPVTGGCHYSFDCEGYTRSCGSCPQLTPSHPRDHSHQTWLRKKTLLGELPISFVAPTSWAATRVRRSSLFSGQIVEKIPLPIDSNLFRPLEKSVARDLLQIPVDKRVIFFGAASLSDPRKGMSHLVEALNLVAERINIGTHSVDMDDILLLVAGITTDEFTSSLPFAIRQLGYVNDDLVLALAYQAADIFVCPSVEDAGPMMIPESMLCATPVVAFNSGGAPDLITGREVGYLAKYKDVSDLARGIETLLMNPNLSTIGRAARQVALSEHAPEVVAQRHIALYRTLIEQMR